MLMTFVQCPDRAICKSSIAHCEKPPHGNITILHNPLSSSRSHFTQLPSSDNKLSHCHTTSDCVTVWCVR